MSTDAEAEATIAKFFAGLAVGVGRMFLDAWAVWLFWGWFIVPLGVRTINYWQALGIDLTVSLFFLFALPTPPAEKDCSTTIWIAAKAVAVLFTVLVGYAVHRFASGLV